MTHSWWRWQNFRTTVNVRPSAFACAVTFSHSVAACLVSAGGCVTSLQETMEQIECITMEVPEWPQVERHLVEGGVQSPPLGSEESPGAAGVPLGPRCLLWFVGAQTSQPGKPQSPRNATHQGVLEEAKCLLVYLHFRQNSVDISWSLALEQEGRQKHVSYMRVVPFLSWGALQGFREE